MRFQLLDADVLVDLHRSHPPAVVWADTLDSSQVAVPGFVALEMIQSARDKREVASSKALLGRFSRVWPSSAACEAALVDYETLHLSHSLGLVDALIGATAREIGAELCTFNVKHYRAMPGLIIVKPYNR